MWSGAEPNRTSFPDTAGLESELELKGGGAYRYIHSKRPPGRNPFAF